MGFVNKRMVFVVRMKDKRSETVKDAFDEILQTHGPILKENSICHSGLPMSWLQVTEAPRALWTEVIAFISEVRNWTNRKNRRHHCSWG